MSVSVFFNLIRWKNLVLIALMQFYTEYFLLSNFGFETTLSNSLLYLLIISTFLITASGYIINDIIDVKGDVINKPNKVIITKNISIANALKLYRIGAFLGIITGSYIAFKIEKPFYSFYFVGISALLYFYSKYLKGKMLIGNFVVSILLAFSMIVVLLFDFPSSLNSLQSNLYLKIQSVIIMYSVFAFLLNFIREIIKDIEDVDGDYNQNYRTLPIIIGKKRTRNIAISITLFTLFLLLVVTFNLVDILTITFSYIIVLIVIPLIYFTYKLWSAATLKSYNHLSKVLKIIILLGIISIPLISIYIKNAFN
jgi:4-hydroxybenzoate polyprenyltransferase